MFAPAWRLGAGFVLLVLAGCAFKLGNSGVQVAVKVDEQVVHEKAEVVAQKIEAEMRRLGLEVVVRNDADALRVVGKTKAGSSFTLTLGRDAAPTGGEHTRVRVTWDGPVDRDLWLQLLVVAGPTTAAR